MARKNTEYKAKRKTSVPSAQKTFSIYMTDEYKSYIQGLAKEQKRSFSNMLSCIVDEYKENHKTKEM